MKIELTHGYSTEIDPEDFPLVAGRKWRVMHTHGLKYAVSKGGVLLHRLIDGTPKGMCIDHIDRDGLNNRRSNLRRCYHWQNRANCAVQRNNTSGFKGAYLHKPTGKWFSVGYCQGVRHHLGTYATKEEAALAYDTFAKKWFGEYANVNFKQIS